MGKRPRRTHSAAFKAKVALAELAQQHDVHPDQITDSKNQLLAKAADVFGGAPMSRQLISRYCTPSLVLVKIFRTP